MKDHLEVLKEKAVALQEQFLRNQGPEESLEEYNGAWEGVTNELIRAAMAYGRGKTTHDGLWTPPSRSKETTDGLDEKPMIVPAGRLARIKQSRREAKEIVGRAEESYVAYQSKVKQINDLVPPNETKVQPVEKALWPGEVLWLHPHVSQEGCGLKCRRVSFEDLERGA